MLYQAPNGWVINRDRASQWDSYCDSLRTLILNDSMSVYNELFIIPSLANDTLNKYLKKYFHEVYCIAEWNGEPVPGMACDPSGKTCSKQFGCLYCPNCK